MEKKIVVTMLPLFSARSLAEDLANAISSNNQEDFDRLKSLAARTDDSEFNKIIEKFIDQDKRVLLAEINRYRHQVGLL